MDHFQEVVVRREITQSGTLRDSETIQDTAKVGLGSRSISVGLDTQTTTGRTAEETVSGSGTVRHRISFGGVSGLMRQFLKSFAPKRFWILLDEWTGIPVDLQPFLAEMLRKLFFGQPQVTVRIAAIPHRTNWRIPGNQGQYLGIEVGAELFCLLDLDEFVVFPARTGAEHADRSRLFFQNLIFRHLNYALSTMELKALPDIAVMMSLLFTQVTAHDELVRAAEGVPRDAPCPVRRPFRPRPGGGRQVRCAARPANRPPGCSSRRRSAAARRRSARTTRPVVQERVPSVALSSDRQGETPLRRPTFAAARIASRNGMAMQLPPR